MTAKSATDVMGSPDTESDAFNSESDGLESADDLSTNPKHALNTSFDTSRLGYVPPLAMLAAFAFALELVLRRLTLRGFAFADMISARFESDVRLAESALSNVAILCALTAFCIGVVDWFRDGLGFHLSARALIAVLSIGTLTCLGFPVLTSEPPILILLFALVFTHITVLTLCFFATGFYAARRLRALALAMAAISITAFVALNIYILSLLASPPSPPSLTSPFFHVSELLFVAALLAIPAMRTPWKSSREQAGFVGGAFLGVAVLSAFTYSTLHFDKAAIAALSYGAIHASVFLDAAPWFYPLVIAASCPLGFGALFSCDDRTRQLGAAWLLALSAGACPTTPFTLSAWALAALLVARAVVASEGEMPPAKRAPERPAG